MYYFDVAIPLDSTDRFIRRIRHKDFKSDNAVLIRHKDYGNFGTFTFKSEYQDDIDYVDFAVRVLCHFIDLPLNQVNWYPMEWR